ncbi:hypothetical protein BH18THE1_BH18THE1_02940 [soil metagenome]
MNKTKINMLNQTNIFIMLAILTVCLVGMINLVYGQDVYGESKLNTDPDRDTDSKLKTKDREHKGEEDNDMITLNNSDIKVNEECIEIKEPKFNGGLDVEVKKYGWIPFPEIGMRMKIPCDNWREVTQYYLDNGYTITFEGDTAVFMSR